MDSLVYLQEQLIRLQRKYPTRPRYCALRMAISSVHALCMRYAKNMQSLPAKPAQHLASVPSIVFFIKGGLGDLILARNYIYCFYKYISAKPFQLKICYHYTEFLPVVCDSLPGVVETGAQLDRLRGALKIELNRYPRVLAGNVEKLRAYSPKLGKILASWQTFQSHNRKLFDLMPQADGLCNDYAQLLGAKRINQADIGGILGMGEEYVAPWPLITHSSEILRQFHLKPGQYITLQRGHSTVEEKSLKNVKLWPVEYYQELIYMLKRQYPHYKLVQLGVSREGFNTNFDGIDVNLRGKTTLEQLGTVLKSARLHIDSEGGLVHFRHALKGGPSVVLFGPTSPAFYGYSENLNLRSAACERPCEWVTDDWLTRCARRTDKNCCMRSLTPQIVLEQIKEKSLL